MIRYYIIAFILGMACMGGYMLYHESKENKELLPGITEADTRQLPPGAKNFKSLGNRWLTFEMEDGKEVRQYYMRRGTRADTPDVIFPAK